MNGELSDAARVSTGASSARDAVGAAAVARPRDPASTSGSLVEMLLDAAARHPDRPALVCGGDTADYAGTFAAARSVAATLAARLPAGGSPFVAFVGSRTLSAYQHLLGIILAGRGYVPLEPEQPARRLASLLGQAEVSCILTESASLPLVAEICRESRRILTVIVTDATARSLADLDLDPHTLVGAEVLSPHEAYAAPVVAPDAPVYMLFTSGSTGVPKAVVITDRNVRALLDAASEVVSLGPDDVTAQLYKLSFDPSVFNILMSWTAGAALVIPTSDMSVLDEAQLISRHGVTMWSSVPSRSTLMLRMRQLKPGGYPTLRYVSQGGEALTSELAHAWSLAAPNALVYNRYGPTEATVFVTRYVWDRSQSMAESPNGRVPIGYPLAGVTIAIVDEEYGEVPDGQVGELLVAGPQVCQGYWRDAERTSQSFIAVRGRPGTYYRTGDLVRRPTAQSPLHFLGRMDHQVKVLGRRIELGEVEAVARAALQVDEAVALGWPETEGGFDGIELFVVASGGRRTEDARDRLSTLLPPEAVPRHVRYVKDLPMTGNGKHDRAELRRMLERSAGRAITL